MGFGQITEAKRYSYINTRIKARKGQLLTAADYERLLSSTLKEGLTYLQNTPRYQESFSTLDPNSMNFTNELERLLYENVYNEVFKLTKDAPEKARDVIEFYLKKSYIKKLKRIIRLIHTKELVSLSLEEFYAVTSEEKVELSIISKTESIEELIQSLQTHWVVEALKSVMVEYKEQKNVLLLENALDHFYYKQLWETIIPYQNKRDLEVAQKIIGMEIDLNNINIILRSKILNFPPEEIFTQLIPINHRLGSNLSQAVRAFSFSDAIDSLKTTVYSDLVQAIYREYREKKKSIIKIEQLQQEWFIQALFAMLARYPFHIGIFLSYVIFRLQETENLRIIFETKWKGIDLKFARELLIYFK